MAPAVAQPVQGSLRCDRAVREFCGQRSISGRLASRKDLRSAAVAESPCP